MSPPRESNNTKNGEYFLKKDAGSRHHLYMSQRKGGKNESSFLTNLKNKYKDKSMATNDSRTKEESKLSLNANSIQFNNSINITNILLNDENGVNKSLSNTNRLFSQKNDGSFDKNSPKKKLLYTSLKSDQFIEASKSRPKKELALKEILKAKAKRESDISAQKPSEKSGDAKNQSHIPGLFRTETGHEDQSKSKNAISIKFSIQTNWDSVSKERVSQAEPYLLREKSLENHKNSIKEGRFSNESTRNSELTQSKTHLHPQELKWEAIPLPVSADFVLTNFRTALSLHEMQEIRSYENVFYIGQRATKIRDGKFSDDKGFYKVMENDQISFRYEVLEFLGKGSFGQVLKVFDHKRKEYAALKIIRSEKKFYNQALVELKILKFLRQKSDLYSENIVKLKDSFVFRGHMCFVFELLSVNLYDLMKSCKFQGFTIDLIRRLSIQILQVLSYLEKCNIIHCDIKPENILLKERNKSGIKVVDFGSSCFVKERLYSYIQSRFYRSPDIILGYKGYEYGVAIDMWSFGVMIFEFFTGYPLFPGENESEQIFLFSEALGLPRKDFLEMCDRESNFFKDDGTLKRREFRKIDQFKPITREFAPLQKCKEPEFVDLIKKCLSWNPQARIKPDEALMHNFILNGLPKDVREQHIEQVKAQSIVNGEAVPSRGELLSKHEKQKTLLPMQSTSSTPKRCQESTQLSPREALNSSSEKETRGAPNEEQHQLRTDIPFYMGVPSSKDEPRVSRGSLMNRSLRVAEFKGDAKKSKSEEKSQAPDLSSERKTPLKASNSGARSNLDASEKAQLLQSKTTFPEIVTSIQPSTTKASTGAITMEIQDLLSSTSKKNELFIRKIPANFNNRLPQRRLLEKERDRASEGKSSSNDS